MANIRKNKVIIYTVAISSLISLVDWVLAFMLAGVLESNLEWMNSILFAVDLILAVVGFIIIGKIIITSATLLETHSAVIIFVLYYGFAYIMEYIIQRTVGYSLLLALLFFPTRIFSVVPQYILWVTSWSTMLFLALTLVFPCIYLLIARMKKTV